MKTSLKRLVLGAATLVLSVVVCAFIVLDVVDGMASVRQRVSDDARRIATVGAPLVLGALIVDDLATAEQTLRAMNADRTIASLRLLAPDGATMLDLSDLQPPAVPAWFRDLLRQELPEIRVPIVGGGVNYGEIAAVAATQAVEEDAWARVRTTVTESLALLGLLFIAIERSLAWGLQPLGALAQAANRFGQGDLAARMPPTAIAEVAETARAFNAMADQLQGLFDALRAKEAANRRLILAIEQSDEAILIVDNQRRIASWNGGAEKLLAITTETAIGRTLEILFEDRPAAEREPCIAQAFAASSATPYEVALNTHDGRRIVVAVSSTGLVDVAERPDGWMVFLRDVTARRQYELRLAEAKRHAELASRSKSEFLANMSHELRTPLNAVIGFSAVMKDGLFGQIDARYADYANDIHASGEHLLQLINDLLDISAIEADQVKLQEIDLDPHDVADAVLRLIQPRATEGSIALTFQASAEIVAVRADERRLKQMLLNLLSNAVKFTPAGGHVSLTLQLAVDGDLELCVQDTGIGMDPSDLVKALERFGQVDGSLSRQHEGTGLGLPLTKGLAELHGGTLRIASARGAGTRATIVLPAERLRRLDHSPVVKRLA